MTVRGVFLVLFLSIPWVLPGPAIGAVAVVTDSEVTEGPSAEWLRARRLRLHGAAVRTPDPLPPERARALAGAVTPRPVATFWSASARRTPVGSLLPSSGSPQSPDDH